MATRKSIQTRARRASIDRLLDLSAASPYMHPLVEIDGDEGMNAARKLEALRRRLALLRLPEMGLIQMAERALRDKETRKPSELEHSSKLYRAIDDLECARTVLESVITELRSMSSWQRGQ